MQFPLKLPNGNVLRISQAEGVLGGVVWPAATSLCLHLLATESKTGSSPLVCSPPMALELGSGTGCVGLYFAAAARRRVILSEHRPPVAAVLSSVAYNVDGTLDYALLEGHNVPKSNALMKLLQKNVDKNVNLFSDTKVKDGPEVVGDSISGGPVPFVEELDWTRSEHADRIIKKYKQQNGFELLFASDVTYISTLHEPLAQTIAKLLDKTSSSSRCWIAHQERVVDLLSQDHQLTNFKLALMNEGLISSVWNDDASENVSNNVQQIPTSPEQGYDATKQQPGSIKILEVRHRSSVLLSGH